MKKLIVLIGLLASAGAWGQSCKFKTPLGETYYGACSSTKCSSGVFDTAGKCTRIFSTDAGVGVEEAKVEYARTHYTHEELLQQDRNREASEEAARQQRVAAKRQAEYDQQQAYQAGARLSQIEQDLAEVKAGQQKGAKKRVTVDDFTVNGKPCQRVGSQVTCY